LDSGALGDGLAGNNNNHGAIGEKENNPQAQNVEGENIVDIKTFIREEHER